MALNCSDFALLVAAAAALIAPASAACTVGTWTDDFAPERCKLQDDAIVISCTEKENSDTCGMRLSEQSEAVGAGNFSMTLKAAPGKGVVTSFFLSNSQPLVKIGFDIFGGAVNPGNSQIWISLFTDLHGEHNELIYVPFDATDDFHTYMLDLTPTTIRYLIDGVVYHTLDISAWGKAKSSIELSSLRRHISLWGKSMADKYVNCEQFGAGTQANCEQFVGMLGKLNDNVNLFPVHASFKPQWNHVASQLSSTVLPVSTITTTLPHSMHSAEVTLTVAELTSTDVATGMPAKAPSIATATIAARTDAESKLTTQLAMAVTVAASVYSSKMAVAMQAASTVPPPSTTAETMPASTGGAATVPPEVALRKGAQSLDNTQSKVASTVATAATVEVTSTALPSAGDDSITTLAVVPYDQTEVAVDVFQHLASNTVLDMTAISIPVILGVAGAIVAVFGAFVAWKKIWSQWRLCYQTLEEPRRCMLDPELLA